MLEGELALRPSPQTTQDCGPATDAEAGRESRWRGARTKMTTWGSAAFLVLVAALALAAPFLPLPDPSVSDYSAVAAPPSWQHWLGTDAIGRDIASRLVWGARISLAVGLGATLIGAVVGTSVGLMAGYAGGWLGGTLMRLMDIVLAFPAIVLALAVLTALGPSMITVTVLIGVLLIPAYARMVRGPVRSLRMREFVLAARACGMGPLRVMVTEVLPNVIPLVVNFALSTFGLAVLVEGGLSFLGVSVPPPTPSWGSMIAEGRPELATDPFISLIPALALSLVVLAANTLGDALERRADPRSAQL